jgi:hypothetical protein
MIAPGQAALRSGNAPHNLGEPADLGTSLVAMARAMYCRVWVASRKEHVDRDGL